MEFTHDARLSLQALAALVNSRRPDTLSSLDELDAYCARWQWSGSRTHDAAELADVRSLRDRLAVLWDLTEIEVVQLVNRLLREGGALPQLVRHDEFDWHIHATDAGAPLAVRMTVEFAMSMIDVVRADGLDRLRHCAASGCDQVLIDLSRNRSRRFCDAGCGNRINVAAYRARRRAAG
ncbi:MAG: CGNR zinc finger domain-containing protein [Micropruina sp.]|uniref:CGNR zinc finger domain-containing protein n=1 Tax=Micropruina sp. TaxID=2737536 RepID=UPI0039E487C7